MTDEVRLVQSGGSGGLPKGHKGLGRVSEVASFEVLTVDILLPTDSEQSLFFHHYPSKISLSLSLSLVAIWLMTDDEGAEVSSFKEAYS